MRVVKWLSLLVMSFFFFFPCQVGSKEGGLIRILFVRKEERDEYYKATTKHNLFSKPYSVFCEFIFDFLEV